MFGVGYIGYMTFVIALLREQGASGTAVTWFYALLGVAVVASSRLWAGLLDRYKGGQVLALFNALLGVATVLPALTSAWPVILASGVLFGAVFLSLVASTTWCLLPVKSLVRRWWAGLLTAPAAWHVGCCSRHWPYGSVRRWRGASARCQPRQRSGRPSCPRPS
jgi:predicted MFS family arabinose efflux permease